MVFERFFKESHALERQLDSNGSSPLRSPALSIDSWVSENTDCSTSSSSSFTFPSIKRKSPPLLLSTPNYKSISQTNIEEVILEEEENDQLPGFLRCQNKSVRAVSHTNQFSRMNTQSQSEIKSHREDSLKEENKSILQEDAATRSIKEPARQLSECSDSIPTQCEDCVFTAKSGLPSSPSRFLREAFSKAGSRRSKPRKFSSASSGIRSRLSSLSQSIENSSMEESSISGSASTENSDLLAAKSNYRIMVLGAKSTGKTSIIQQFLYDKFSTHYKETIDEMYRGEFDIHGRTIGFDIQDVSGGYVYDFPGMRNVSFASTDAFVLVYSMDSVDSWQEISNLRDMIHSDKGEKVPIVVVGNKSDLKTSRDPEIPHESVEATVVFDWENGYVESSAKDRFNINKIFKELLQQSKAKYYFETSSSSSASVTGSQCSNSPFNTPTKMGHQPAGFDWIKPNSRLNSSIEIEDCLKRRQSLPAVCPAHTIAKSSEPSNLEDLQNAFKNRPMHSPSQLACGNKNNLDNSTSHRSTEFPTPDMRRLSLAASRKDSCKIS